MKKISYEISTVCVRACLCVCVCARARWGVGGPKTRWTGARKKKIGGAKKL